MYSKIPSIKIIMIAVVLLFALSSVSAYSFGGVDRSSLTNIEEDTNSNLYLEGAKTLEKNTGNGGGPGNGGGGPPGNNVELLTVENNFNEEITITVVMEESSPTNDSVFASNSERSILVTLSPNENTSFYVDETRGKDYSNITYLIDGYTVSGINIKLERVATEPN